MPNFFHIHEAEIPNQFIRKFPGNIELWIKREDLLHEQVSGNKFRKLKYNLIVAEKLGYERLLSFGGAHSNHIAALAAAGKLANFETIGIIRGEELEFQEEKWSHTLKFARTCGMNFKFVSRSEYREKNTETFQKKLKAEFGQFYLIPEGGTNELAIKGCEEILKAEDENFNFIAVSVGTGGTISGLINSSAAHQKILGFPALKTDYLRQEVENHVNKSNWELILNYHFGGYAKTNAELIAFLNQFYKDYQIKLDPVYTGKLVFGIFDLIKKGYFPSDSKILAIHTGGLQGIEGMNQMLKKKKMPQINY
ncbi:1-aminocyclopropane-1-carboxylate deaminase [Christiangramia fulva]|uniref:1-aminocyclopropane-1-carboxylate deaminase n=1 Tax=Christiangramia fulva TaxID=2126553 RepID=A0A2R3Z510_9FLAO|nr:pyridoxal-phosphate dependent enzyme [Christiangramia fulva]AVR45367.1 1-aminocyclopropane-1-carboxylate deaminase [Christiangramia fulva]